MPVRILRNFITAALFLFSIACGAGETTNPTLPTILPSGSGAGNTLTGDCNNKYLPVKQDATWTYYSVGGPNGDFSYSDTISEIHDGGFALTSRFPNSVLTQEWLCTPEGLVARQLGGGTTAGVSMQNMITDFKTLEVSGMSLPAEITPGMKWNYKLTAEGSVAIPGESVQSPGTFDLNLQQVGTETVSLAAGTFEAVKIQTTFQALINVDFQGSFFPYKVNGSSILWYAPGIGFIKSVENIDFSGTSFTSNTELQSYSIP